VSPREIDEAGSATSVLASGVAYLQPEDAVLEAMFEGWAAQQRSRRLAATTVENRAHVVRRFVDFTNDYPWRWAPADAEAWTSSLVEAGMAHSTIRNYQAAIATFLGYACDTRYGWSAICSERFGEAPEIVGGTREAGQTDDGRARVAFPGEVEIMQPQAVMGEREAAGRSKAGLNHFLALRG